MGFGYRPIGSIIPDPPVLWPGNTKDFSSFAERKTRVIEAIPNAQASPLTPRGMVMTDLVLENLLVMVFGGFQTPKINMGEYMFNKKLYKKVEMGRSKTAKMRISLPDVLTWRFVEILHG